MLLTIFFLVVPWFFLPGAESGLPFLALAYLGMTVLQIGFLIFFLHRLGRPLPDFGLRRPRCSTWGWMGLSLAGAAVILGLCSLGLFIIMGEGAGETLWKRPFTRPPSPLEMPLLVLFCAAVGYREEIFFRSYFITRLEDLGVPPVWGVIGSGVVFGIMHFYEGLFGVVTAGLIGVFFGLVFIKKRDLHIVAGAHALYNLGVWTIGFLLQNK
jgi:membrane protease YdiL (CAAX protease family)